MVTVSNMVEEPASVTDMKRMRLRYAGTCVRCGTPLAAGTTADYDRASKTVACVECPPRRALTDEAADAPLTVDSPPIPEKAADPAPPRLAVAPLPSLGVVDGQGGASTAAEFQRRHNFRQERVLTNHPRIGRFLLAVFYDPQSTRAWSVGAEGSGCSARRWCPSPANRSASCTTRG